MATLDMSLDDVIKSRRNSERGRGRGRGPGIARRGRGKAGTFGGGRPTGPARGGRLGVNARPSAYSIAKKLKHGRVYHAIKVKERFFLARSRKALSSTSYLYSDLLGSSIMSCIQDFTANLLDEQKFFGTPSRNFRTGALSCTISQSFRRPKNLPWQRDLFEESLKAVGLPGFENDAKLYVSNLDIGVTNEDIRELFSEIGELKRYAIHYDKSGRPCGSAEVLFARRSDAFQALKRYNNVQLDGKPMKIEIVGTNSDNLVSARLNVVGGVNGRRTVVMTPGVARGRGSGAFSRVSGQRNRGGMRNGRGGGGVVGGRGGGRGRGRAGGRGRGRGRKTGVDKSADELDKDLENYHAMQT